MKQWIPSFITTESFFSLILITLSSCSSLVHEVLWRVKLASSNVRLDVFFFHCFVIFLFIFRNYGFAVRYHSFVIFACIPIGPSPRLKKRYKSLTIFVTESKIMLCWVQGARHYFRVRSKLLVIQTWCFTLLQFYNYVRSIFTLWVYCMLKWLFLRFLKFSINFILCLNAIFFT